jgi:hypothetical protein
MAPQAIEKARFGTENGARRSPVIEGDISKNPIE